MIIIDEKGFVENVLNSHHLPQSIPTKKFIILLAEYYYSTNNRTQIGLIRLIQEKMKALNLPIYRYDPVDDESFIKNTVKRIFHGELPKSPRHPSIVAITKPELEIIQKAKSDNGKKVMTTLYVLAKLAAEPSGWVGYKRSDVFSLANTRLTRRERNRVVYELQKDKLVELHPFVNNTSLRVKLIDGEIAFKVTDFEHIGNTYIDKYKDGWRMCQNCGKLIHLKSGAGRPKKYCKNCAPIVDVEKAKKRMKLKRKSSKN